MRASPPCRSLQTLSWPFERSWIIAGLALKKNQIRVASKDLAASKFMKILTKAQDLNEGDIQHDARRKA